jgi:hypothetical protein
MTDATLLLRQVHSSWVQEGRVTSQAFKPTPKDEGRLSVYDGDQIEAEASWRHFTSTLQRSSVGVLGITVGEFRAESLSVIPDPDTFPEHVLVDYRGHTAGQVEKKSKRLRSIATERGWQFLAVI